MNGLSFRNISFPLLTVPPILSYLRYEAMEELKEKRDARTIAKASDDRTYFKFLRRLLMLWFFFYITKDQLSLSQPYSCSIPKID